MIWEVNLELGRPSADEALRRLEHELAAKRHLRAKAMKIIHGYGSSGKGGRIRTASRKYLRAAQEQGRIYAVLPGERLTIFDEALGREIGRINTNREETVCIAAYSSIAIHWLPEVIQQFRHNHPGVDVEIRMGNIEDVFRWVSEDKMDLGFASRQEGMTLEWVRLRDDPLLAILPPDYDLDGRRSFPVEGFSGEEFLMPSLGFHQDILRVMRGGGAEPVYRSPQVSDNVIISMVEHGLGLSILSELVLRGRQDDVLAVPLDPPAVREIGVAMRSRKEMPLMVRRFLNEARDMIETL